MEMTEDMASENDQEPIKESPSAFSETGSESSEVTELLVLNSKFDNSVSIQDVRLTPAEMVFENAYEGKHFKRTLVIQNCGKRLAFVRICSASAAAFKYKPLHDGCFVSPGLKIVRTVTFVYRSALAVMKAFATIWINEQSIDYPLIVTLSAAVISIEPDQLDFGRIDAVNAATTRTLFIKNSGYKGAQFAIDLGRNELGLIVEPMKGIIPAKTEVKVSVEIVGSQEGDFTEEFWIKTTPPQRVVIFGTFILPKIMVRKFISSLDFTLIEFPKTYYGSRCTRPLVIKNHSPSDSMFYVMAEIKGSVIPLEEAKKIDDNYNSFTFHPQDGRLSADNGSVVQFTFIPKRNPSKEKTYAACFFKIIRMDCRDVGYNALDEMWEAEKSDRTRSMSVSSAAMSLHDNGTRSAQPSIVFEPPPSQADSDPRILSFEHSIRVCLHGEKEETNLFLRPDLITLTELQLGETYVRVLYVKNLSHNLPITLKYCKTPSVEVMPDTFYLDPEADIEVTVSFHACRLGTTTRSLKFDLLAPDFPDDEKIVRRVGQAAVKIEFDTKTVVKRKRLKQCCVDKELIVQDLKLKLESGFPFRLSDSTLNKKVVNNTYYNMYIRRKLASIKISDQDLKDFSDYDPTNKLLLMQENLKCACACPKEDIIVPYSVFIPLAPRQLYSIKVIPKSLKLHTVAAYTSTSESFTIENQNPFPVRFIVKPSKPCIFFEDGGRYVLRPGEKKAITFLFSSKNYGRYNINLDVLVNESCFFQVTVVAQVAPKTLKLEALKIEFAETDDNYKFFDLVNELNAFTHFEWQVPKGCFKIYPMEGCVGAERKISCVVTLEPHPAQSDVAECVLTSESGEQTIVQFSYKLKEDAVAFDVYAVDFGLVPLNLLQTRRIIMRNFKPWRVIYNIPDADPIPGISVNPREGILNGHDSQTFVISLQLKAVMEFSTKFTVHINNETEITIELSGLVDYPKVELSPDMLYFRKISPYSFDRLAFKVKNRSKLECNISFPMEDFPELTVTEFEDISSPHLEQLCLRASEGKILYLHFHPDYISTCSFFMPYVVNDLLGPCASSGSQSLSTEFFLSEFEDSYQPFSSVHLLKNYPKTLSVMRVNCCAVDKKVEFSALTYNFGYFGKNHFSNYVHADFKICNTYEESIKICIRLDSLDDPFSLQPKDEENENIEFNNISYVITLDQSESVTFIIGFTPSETGDYKVKLPIFLRNYYDDKIFNYLTLNGSFSLPTITPSKTFISLEPVHVKIRNEIHMTLQMKNHLPKCQVFTTSGLNGLFAIFQDGRNTANDDADLPVLLTYTALKNITFDTSLTFHCTCNASAEVYVKGLSENCIFSSHAFTYLLKSAFTREELVALINPVTVQPAAISTTSLVQPTALESYENNSTTCYPYFPKEEDQSDYANHMRKVLRSVENWLFSQGFLCKYYYRIPDGFINFCKEMEPPAKKKKKKYSFKKPRFDLPLVELILNLIGNKFRKFLTANENLETEDEIERLTALCRIYANCLSFLRQFNAYLPNIKVRYLLNYDQYNHFKKLKPQINDQKFDENSFYLYTKQCWLDLVLQIVKAFVLKRIDQPTKNITVSKSQLKKASSLDLSQEAEENLFDFPSGEDLVDSGLHGVKEKLIMEWLETHYEKQRHALWPEGVPETKILLFFDDDFQDGLVLGAVTASYCPYVKHFIEDMFIKPASPEEHLHNHCQLVKTWKLLKFSYTIDPISLASANMVEILLLCCYLYEILPSCSPRETIKIDTFLTQTRKAEVEIQNCGHSLSLYEILFFGNESGHFYTEDTKLKVAGGQKKTLNVEYRAKTLKAAAATLFISGETPGHRYGQNIVIEFQGIPDVTYSFAEVAINVNMYKPCEAKVVLESPFKMAAEYVVSFAMGEGSSQVIMNWDELKNIKTIKEILIAESLAKFDEEGRRVVTPTICCMHSGVRDIWIYYTNKELGDFAINAKINGRVTESNFEDVEVVLPEDYESLTCTCKKKIDFNNKRCPKIVQLHLPAMNHLLWNARKGMILATVEEPELLFWKKRIYTTVGTHIIMLLLNSETHPAAPKIQTKVKYIAVADKNCPFKTIKTIVIDDVTSEESVQLPIHPLPERKLAQTTTIFRLASEDETEKRFYRLTFTGATAESTKTSECTT